MVVQAVELTKDEAQIRSNINGFSSLADQGAFEYLGRLLAPELVVDYTSLFPGEAEVVSRSELMKRWAGFLPGFETTYHDIGNIDLVISGDQAAATAEFTASHWMSDGGFWSVSGHYDFRLHRSKDNWEIIAIKLITKGESGDRAVLVKAPEYAEKNLNARKDLLVSYE